MSDASSDDFSALDLPEFTEQDFAQIDDAVARSLASIQALDRSHHLYSFQTNPGPTIPIELESPPGHISPAYSTTTPPVSRSPLQRYRSTRVLSVTDLVAPAWCELQFEYGLLGKRSRPLAQRPKSFISSSGKEIRVEEKTAIINDQTTKRGQAVHKKLEREIHPEEVIVQVSTKEEQWALRLINMMHCLKEVASEGFTREMPVFGLIENEAVVGIIDEVTRVPLESTGNDVPTFCLQITDTKTRRTNTLPPEEDTLSGRLQVMLYHRLLSALVSHSEPFQFSSLWQKLKLDASRSFSPNFLVQTGLVTDANPVTSACLDELSKSWCKLVQETAHSIHPTLRLTYRLQSLFQDKGKGKYGEASEIQNLIGSSSPQNAEELMLQWAILQSLGRKSSVLDCMFPPPPDLSEESGTSSYEQPTGAHVSPSGDVENTHSNVIGTKEVFYDPKLLDNHISNVFRWWRGERKPNGVPLSLSRRCQTCEYNNDCEWREQKAKEFSRNARQRDDDSIA